jgi:hypothetical protein
MAKTIGFILLFLLLCWAGNNLQNSSGNEALKWFCICVASAFGMFGLYLSNMTARQR